MADNDDVTQGLMDDGPWNLDWEGLASKAGNVLEQAGSAVTEKLEDLIGTKMPWDQSGSDLAKITANERPVDTNPLPSVQQPAVASPVTSGSLFSRLVNTESGGQHLDANGNLLTSSKGAQGITQVMPKTGGDPGFGVTPIQDNSVGEYVRFGRDYLNAMLKHFGGNQEMAVAAYNAGPGRIEKAVAKSQKTGGDWKLYVPEETRNYVKRILNG